MRNIILSGVKPTGIPTLGNYLGAFKNFVKMQEQMSDYELFMFIADMHAITVPQDSVELRRNIKNLAAIYLACGLKRDNLTLFIQSEVPEHLELGYVMQSVAYMGEMERMTQFKDKMAKQEKAVTTALFTYPALMAADIILYDAKYVPVGEDQMQHLELTRDLATRFNNRFGNTFVVPEGIVTKTGARIMDLQNPTKKMAKSDDEGKGCIYLLDPIPVIKKKIKSAVTDNLARVHFDTENQPGVSNLMTIYSAITGESYDEIEKKYEGHGYGDFKGDLAEIVANEIQVLQNRFNEIINSKELDEILDEGREKASYLAKIKMKKVYHKLGIGRN